MRLPTFPALHFGPFRLEPDSARLLLNGQTVSLSPKAFDVLIFLCARAPHLANKDELLDGVWRRSHISEGVIKNTIQELRRALGDDPKAPRFIETVHRRGYRFIADLRDASSAEPHQPVATGAIIVGRDETLTKLKSLLDDMLRGRTVTVFVSGGPGIGKTALIRTFLRQVGSRAVCVQGQCADQYGRGEPYLPLLESVSQLTRQGGAECIQLLRRCAPTWLTQLPWLVEDSDRVRLLRDTQGVTKERMLRELSEFLHHWTATHPLVVVIEDLHWSDRATLDAISYLSKRDDARLVIFGSYRTADVMVKDHPFHAVRSELLLHRLCHDIPLPPLSRTDVEAYLHQRLACPSLPTTLVDAVYRRTEGLPLFVVRIADELSTRTADDLGGVEHALKILPEGLAHLVTLQLERLTARQRGWIEIAAVRGRQFSAVLLAQLTGTPTAEAEGWCEEQAYARALLRHMHEQPQGPATEYTFIHAYYKELTYSLIPPMRRAELHRKVGLWLEQHGSNRESELAVELAIHFERAADYERAAKYLEQAALNAFARHANGEAAELLRRGVELTDRHAPDTPDNQRLRLAFLTRLPSALIASRGYAVPELPALYERTQALAEQLGDDQAQYFTLYRNWMFRCAAGKLDTALKLARALHASVANDGAPMRALAACWVMGSTLFHSGANIEARDWFEQALAYATALGEPDDSLCRSFGEDIFALLLSLHGLNSHMLGELDRSLSLMRAAHERAHAVAHPYTQAAVLVCETWLYRERGEPERVREYISRLNQLAFDHGYPFITAIVDILKGWVTAVMESDPAAIDLIRAAMKTLEKTGSRTTRPIYYHQLAEACIRLGHWQAGLTAIDESLAEIAFGGEHRYEAEAYILRGELLLASKLPGENPAKCFERAFTLARSQAALYLQMRAAYGLVRLQVASGNDCTALPALREAIGAFSSLFSTPTLNAARALLLEQDR